LGPPFLLEHFLTWRFVIVFLLLPLLPKSALTPETERLREIGRADLIRVIKSERRMMLERDGKVIATYNVALGRNPDGHKQQEGDMRTPEGRYTIDWRNPQSKYHLSLHVSYPNKADKEQAEAKGVSPGGDIMIHGQPNGYGQPASMLLQQADWTHGCIAVTSAEMDEIWKAVPDGTPIEILP
jgi:murein L,D-transpeptidase YafK